MQNIEDQSVMSALRKFSRATIASRGRVKLWYARKPTLTASGSFKLSDL